MSLEDEIVSIALELAPDQVTIVPENRREVTTEGGLDCLKYSRRLREVAGRFRSAGITVSAFIDPDTAQIKAAAGAGCPAIEIHTGRYANALRPPDGSEPDTGAADREIKAIEESRLFAQDLDLVVHAGHGLDYRNTARLAAIKGFEEFNIGHSIISRAVFVGLRQAVEEMNRLLQ